MEKEVFKQSLLGFDRNQVIKYIDDLLKQIKNQEEEYAKKQEELETQVKLLQDSIDKNENDYEQAKEAVELLKQGIIDAAKTNQALEEKLSKCKDFIVLKENDYNKLKLQLNTSSQEIEKVVAENDYWKSRQEEISTTLIDARLKANDIINEAKEEAVVIKDRFQGDAQSLAKEFMGVKRSIEDIETQLEQSFLKVKSAISLIDKSSEVIQDKITNYSLAVENFAEKPKENTYKKTTNSYKKEVKHSLLENLLENISNLLDK